MSSRIHALVAAGVISTLASGPASAREVMGFLPYWEGEVEIRWDVVTTVAYFEVGVHSDGSLGEANGWPDDPYVASLIQAASREGRRIVLTVTNFDANAISSLVRSDEARERFIDAIIPLVHGAGAHGINIDFEFVAAEDRDAFTYFVTEVAAAFHNAHPDHHVSVALPAIDWSGAYDVAGLLAAADAVFVMGYNYHYRGGDPGPVAPISSGTIWPAGADLGRSIDDYASQISAEEAHRIVLGLPLYGFDWPALSDEPGAERPRDADGNALDEAVSVRYGDWLEGVSEADVLWDIESATPWYAYEDETGLRQVWSEDATSMAAKVDLAVEHGLGVGFWALGYAGTDRGLWDAVAERAADDPPPPEPDPKPDAGSGSGAGVDAGAGAGAELQSSGCAAGGSAPLYAALALAVLAANLRSRRW